MRHRLRDISVPLCNHQPSDELSSRTLLIDANSAYPKRFLAAIAFILRVKRVKQGMYGRNEEFNAMRVMRSIVGMQIREARR
jgi:hypothetical protein